MRRTAGQPTVITDAEPSPGDQLRGRQRRYVLMMSIRGICLIVGAVLVTSEAPLLWLWLPICAVGMILVPWLAVLLANDRPPKDRHRMRNQRRQPTPRGGPAQVGAVPTTPSPVRVIDVEP
ncbi:MULTISPECIES: DUF3099 domain-containing protein [Micromonosporaceae]|uniref:DUF3099 domain-containing protein n=1 Tax=Micromonosporaceae TaxID=28056 RepID=UPI002415E378|nr:DUF3099 domain-containing protein [Solwaraspora sp. WMMD792]MDG4770003.1 DUF3099 domain-containing protein [Solwaraspora sp. WMMD792]